MPEFRGTVKEFHRYIGPRLRNLIQIISRGYKRDIGKCEHCGSTERLESAHIEGKDRITLIMESLNGCIQNDNLIVDLESFEERFKTLHDPLNESFKILCKNCHNEYDNKTPVRINNKNFLSAIKEEKEEKRILEIKLIPSDREQFKEALIKAKKAKIDTFFKDGKVSSIIWDAPNISNASNIFGNLRSRPDFRQGNWQKSGIKNVIVTIEN